MHNHCNAQSLQWLQWQQWKIKSNVHCVISATFTPACKKWLHVACVALNDVHQWCPLLISTTTLMSTTTPMNWTAPETRETWDSNTDELFEIVKKKGHDCYQKWSNFPMPFVSISLLETLRRSIYSAKCTLPREGGVWGQKLVNAPRPPHPLQTQFLELQQTLVPSFYLP